MRTESPLIRTARREDCAALMELIRELAQFERAPQEVTVTLSEFEDAGFGLNPAYKAFVAEAQGKLLGFALCYIRYSTWKGKRLYLEDILVTENERGKGIGSLLFEECIREAQRSGLDGMVWMVLEWNEPAIKFYKKYQTSFDSEWITCALSRQQVNGMVL